MAALPLCAQDRKAGLWEVTSNMTFIQPALPPGMPNPAAGPRTMQVCLTQADMDKPWSTAQQNARSCKMTNVVNKGNSLTADMECSGSTPGKGTFEQTWTDSEHAKGKVHFTGTMKNGKPLEWSVESTSVFKSADCGNVKPLSAEH